MLSEWSYLVRAVEKLWEGFLAGLSDDYSDPLAFALRIYRGKKEANLIFSDQVLSKKGARHACVYVTDIYVYILHFRNYSAMKQMKPRWIRGSHHLDVRSRQYRVVGKRSSMQPRTQKQKNCFGRSFCSIRQCIKSTMHRHISIDVMEIQQPFRCR